MKIKFYDNGGCDYPIIDIWREDYDKFKKLLKDYQKEEDYNLEGFYDLLEENEIQYNLIIPDEERFF